MQGEKFLKTCKILQNLDSNQSYLIDWIQCAFVYTGEFRLVDAENFSELLACSEEKFVQFIAAGENTKKLREVWLW